MIRHAAHFLFALALAIAATSGQPSADKPPALAVQAPAAPPTPLEIVVRPTDLDVNSHVNNARYVEYLQCGRWDWLEKHGLSHDRLRELKAVPVVVRMVIDFKKECRQGDVLSVVTFSEPEQVTEKSFMLRQEIRRRDGVVAAYSIVVMVAFDPVTRASRPLPEELRRVLMEEPKP